MKFRMLFPAVVVYFPNSKLCLIGEWSIGLKIMRLTIRNGVIWESIALFLTNQIAENAIDFKMNVIKYKILSTCSSYKNSQ